MVNQKNIPAFPEDRDKFKEIAAARKVSMKDLFHEIVVLLQSKPAVELPEEASGLK
jgi:hypothetical protein